MRRALAGRVLAGIAALVVVAGGGAAWGFGHHAHRGSAAAQVNAARATAEAASLSGCRTGWTCVSRYAHQLGIKVQAPPSTSADRFLDAHIIGQGGLEYCFKLSSGEQVIVFALPTALLGASGIPGGPRSAVVVQGRRGAWLPSKPQGLLTWQEAGMRYRAWYPSSVTQQVAVATANEWIAA